MSSATVEAARPGVPSPCKLGKCTQSNDEIEQMGVHYIPNFRFGNPIYNKTISNGVLSNRLRPMVILRFSFSVGGIGKELEKIQYRQSSWVGSVGLNKMIKYIWFNVSAKCGKRVSKQSVVTDFTLIAIYYFARGRPEMNWWVTMTITYKLKGNGMVELMN